MEHPSLFTDFKNSEGYFGVGKIPTELQDYTREIHSLFFQSIPKENLSAKTYHQWYDNFTPEVKQLVSKLQEDPFWKNTCSSQSNCQIINVKEMDELYYSKAPGTKRKDLFLYGATGNFDPHIDGIFMFPGVRFYRILIGLTPNKTVETHFLNLDIQHKIQPNDYIVFDFDKALHQVVNTNNDPSNDYRIMLKLHFLVCDSCTPSSYYLSIVKQFYIMYEKITRYFMQTGTEPKTYYQFLLGLICMMGNSQKIMSILLFLSILLIPISSIFKWKKLWRRRLLYFVGGWTGLLFVFTFILWSRYQLTGLR